MSTRLEGLFAAYKASGYSPTEALDLANFKRAQDIESDRDLGKNELEIARKWHLSEHDLQWIIDCRGLRSFEI